MINLKKFFLIYGYGISGRSIENYLINKNCKYNIYDDYKKIKNKKNISKNYLLNNLKKFDYFIVSPSIKIKKNHFLYKFKKKILIDLDFLSLEISYQKIIGVTGTEGKSSTCFYINEILSKKYSTKIIGNYGNTILDKKNLNKYLSKIDYLIVELSSYQLDKIKFLKLKHALITNIYSDHLDYHINQKNYINSKFRILKLLNTNSNLYLSKKTYLEFKNYLNDVNIFLSDDLSIKKNNINEYFKAINLNSIKKLIKIIDNDIKLKAINISLDLKFRNELVYKSKKLFIYNDSKCTNLNNAVYKNDLIKSKNKILILGGKLKKQENNLKLNISDTLVLIFGNYSDLYINNLNFINSRFYKFSNLKDLTNFLKIIIKFNKYNFILFSPGGESFDYYNNYIDRGKHFNNLIKKIKI